VCRYRCCRYGYLESRREIAEAGYDALVQREGALHGELQHDGVDAEGGDAQEDAGEDDQPGHGGLEEGPAHQRQQDHGRHARHLAHQRHLPCIRLNNSTSWKTRDKKKEKSVMASWCNTVFFD